MKIYLYNWHFAAEELSHEVEHSNNGYTITTDVYRLPCGCIVRRRQVSYGAGCSDNLDITAVCVRHADWGHVAGQSTNVMLQLMYKDYGLGKYHITPAESRIDYVHADPSSQTLQPMTAYLELDLETHDLEVCLYHQIDGVPMRVWHGITRRYHLPESIDAVALTEAINSGEFDGLFDAILDGSDVYWDGSNWKGTLTDAGYAAEDELRDKLQDYIDYDIGGLWDAGDWLQFNSAEDLGVSSDTPDYELEELATKLESDAESVCVRLWGTLDYLETLRDLLREFEEEEA